MKTLKRINLLRFEQERIANNEKRMLVGGQLYCKCACACGSTCSCSYARMMESAFYADASTSSVSNNGSNAIMNRGEESAFFVGEQD